MRAYFEERSCKFPNQAIVKTPPVTFQAVGKINWSEKLWRTPVGKIEKIMTFLCFLILKISKKRWLLRLLILKISTVRKTGSIVFPFRYLPISKLFSVGRINIVACYCLELWFCIVKLLWKESISYDYSGTAEDLLPFFRHHYLEHYAYDYIRMCNNCKVITHVTLTSSFFILCFAWENWSHARHRPAKDSP